MLQKYPGSSITEPDKGVPFSMRYDSIGRPERQKGLWSYLTWSFFLAQATAMSGFFSGQAEASDTAAATGSSVAGADSSNLLDLGSRWASGGSMSNGEPSIGNSISESTTIVNASLNGADKMTALNGHPTFADQSGVVQTVAVTESMPFVSHVGSSSPPPTNNPDPGHGVVDPPDTHTPTVPGGEDPSGPIGGIVDPIIDIVDDVVDGVVAPVVGVVGDLVESVVAPVVGLVGDVLEGVVGGVVAPVIEVVADVVAPVVEIVGDVVENVLAPVVGVVGDVVEGVVAPVVGVVGDVVGGVVAPVTSLVGDVVEDVVAPVTDALAPVTDVVGDLLGGLLSPVANVVEDIVDAAAPAVEPITNALDLGELLAATGDIVPDLGIDLAGLLGEPSGPAEGGAYTSLAMHTELDDTLSPADLGLNVDANGNDLDIDLAHVTGVSTNENLQIDLAINGTGLNLSLFGNNGLL